MISDMAFLVGSCEDTLNFYLEANNSKVIGKSARSVLIGQEECSQNIPDMLRAAFGVAGTENLRPVRFWMVYPKGDQYFVYGGAFLNRITVPKVFELGK